MKFHLHAQIARNDIQSALLWDSLEGFGGPPGDFGGVIKRSKLNVKMLRGSIKKRKVWAANLSTNHFEKGIWVRSLGGPLCAQGMVVDICIKPCAYALHGILTSERARQAWVGCEGAGIGGKGPL